MTEHLLDDTLPALSTEVWAMAEEAPRWHEAAYFFWIFFVAAFGVFLLFYWKYYFRKLPPLSDGCEDLFLPHGGAWRDAGNGFFWLLVIFSSVPIYLDIRNAVMLFLLLFSMWTVCPRLAFHVMKIPRGLREP